MLQGLGCSQTGGVRRWLVESLTDQLLDSSFRPDLIKIDIEVLNSPR